MSRPSFIGNYQDFLDDDTAAYEGSTELLSIGSAVGKKLGLQKIGIHIEILPPGRRTSWPHAESEEEEFGFVIEGTPDVWINGDLHRLKAGDFVAFPSGTGILHVFINNSLAPVKLLVGGERTKATNKIIYSENHTERNMVMKAKGALWENPPVQKMGGHNGEPDKMDPRKWSLPIFETNRLILRPLELTDAPAMHRYTSMKEVTEFVSWEPHGIVTDTEKFIKMMQTNYLNGTPAPYGIFLKTNPNDVIGTAGLLWSIKPYKIMELGAVLHPEHWGRGIVAEAFIPLIDYAWKNLDVERIQGRCMKGHMKSRKLMEKLGMTYEGLIRSSFPSRGQMKDMEMFSLVRSDLL